MSLLSLVNISKSFASGKEDLNVLRNLNLQIQEGDFCTIKGRSGSGKSTLLHIMGGLDSADSGQVLYKQKDTRDFSKNDWLHFRRFEVGFIFQFFHLFPRLTTLQNTMVPSWIAGQAQKQKQERAQDLLVTLGLEKQMHQKAQTLSGGEMQRVAIARALLQNPKLLLADEPTGNLDLKNSERLLEELIDLKSKNNLTLVMITHDDDVFNLGQTKLIIENGQLKSA